MFTPGGLLHLKTRQILSDRLRKRRLKSAAMSLKTVVNLMQRRHSTSTHYDQPIGAVSNSNSGKPRHHRDQLLFTVDLWSLIKIGATVIFVAVAPTTLVRTWRRKIRRPFMCDKYYSYPTMVNSAVFGALQCIFCITAAKGLYSMCRVCVSKLACITTRFGYAVILPVVCNSFSRTK